MKPTLTAPKIMIGYDGSSYADVAIDSLQHAGLGLEVEALIVTAVEDFLPPIDAAQSFELPTAAAAMPRRVVSAIAEREARARQVLNEAQARVDDATRLLLARCPQWHVQTEVLQGTAANAMLLRAATYQPDVIVVGTQGRSMLGRLLLGSVSQKILTEAACAVRIGRATRHVTGADEVAPPRIVIGIDGSPHALHAVEVVAQRCWATGGEAHLVGALRNMQPHDISAILPTVSAAVIEHQHQQEAAIVAQVEQATEMLYSANLHVTATVRQSLPQRLLLEVAAQKAADCIFVGSRGFSSKFERLRLGSVSGEIAMHATCSVEVVR